MRMFTMMIANILLMAEGRNMNGVSFLHIARSTNQAANRERLSEPNLTGTQQNLQFSKQHLLIISYFKINFNKNIDENNNNNITFE